MFIDRIYVNPRLAILSFWAINSFDALYTEHGFLHIIDVWDYILMIVNELRKVDSIFNLNRDELLLLNVATMYHDVGMICRRDGHEISGRELFQTYIAPRLPVIIRNKSFGDYFATDIIGDIIESHAGKFLRIFQLWRRYRNLTRIRVAYLALLLRLADEFSLVYTHRTPIELFEILEKCCLDQDATRFVCPCKAESYILLCSRWWPEKSESRFHWLFHLSIHRPQIRFERDNFQNNIKIIAIRLNNNERIWHRYISRDNVLRRFIVERIKKLIGELRYFAYVINRYYVPQGAYKIIFRLHGTLIQKIGNYIPSFYRRRGDILF